jgi:hypothetical protein
MGDSSPVRTTTFAVFAATFLAPAEFPSLSEQELLFVLSLPGSILPGGYELYRRLVGRVRITSVALDTTSPEAMFNERMRNPDSYDPFYAGQFSIKQSEQLTEWTPFEVSNEASSPITVRSVFLEVYQPLNGIFPTKYPEKPKVITEFGVQPDLPCTISAGAVDIIRVSTSDILKIGFSNELVTSSGRVGPYMRFGFSTRNKIRYTTKFHFGNYAHFVSLMVSTKLRKKLALTADEYIRNRSSPSSLCDEVIKIYSEGVAWTPDLTSLVYLQQYLHNNYPGATEYAKEAQSRLDKIIKPLAEGLEKALNDSGMKGKIVWNSEDKPPTSTG